MALPTPRALADLLNAAGLPLPADVGSGTTVSSAAYNSRTVTPGAIFVAIDGFHVDGHSFTMDAIRHGAVAVVAERPPEPGGTSGVPVVIVDNSRAALAALSAELYDHPARRLCVAGITGTDGKTTTSTMLWAAWRGAGLTAGCTTTVDIRLGEEIRRNTTRQTTLEAPQVQEMLSMAVADGCTHLALETSSHSLALHRVDGVEYMAAVYTPITSEHLDLHGSRENYVQAKARLLSLLDPQRDSFAMFDFDDADTTALLRSLTAAPQLTYSSSGNPDADLRAVSVLANESETTFVAQTPWGNTQMRLQIPGRFNIGNALAALGTAVRTGADLGAAAAGISELRSVTGRMERVAVGQPFSVVIDYAHTADSLAKVLAELRPLTSGRLWVVFGSGGERDLGKRPEMGRIAARSADMVVLTDEDPRGEDRHAILEQIAAGAEAAGSRRGQNLFLIAEREEAIRYAMERAEVGDTVLLAGKGHESSLLTGTESRPYDERAVAEAVLRERY